MLIVSVPLIILGILVAVFGVMLSGNEKVEKVFDNEYVKRLGIENEVSGFSTAMVFAGVFCIATGVLGVLTGKLMKPFFACPFIFSSFAIGFVLTFVGAAAIVVISNQKMLKENICETKVKELGDKSVGDIIPEQYGSLVDKWMCSPAGEDNGVKGCPCPESAKGSWKDVTEETYNGFGRTIDAILTDEDKLLGPLADKTLVSFVPNGKPNFNTWLECYNGPITDQMKEKADDENWKKIIQFSEEFINKGGDKFL